MFFSHVVCCAANCSATRAAPAKTLKSLFFQLRSNQVQVGLCKCMPLENIAADTWELLLPKRLHVDQRLDRSGDHGLLRFDETRDGKDVLEN